DRARDHRADARPGVPGERGDGVHAGTLARREGRERDRVPGRARPVHEPGAQRERRDHDGQIGRERRDERERHRPEHDADDRGHGAETPREEPAVRERAEAAGDGDHAEEHAERRERNAEALGEEQVRERQKASGAETEQRRGQEQRDERGEEHQAGEAERREDAAAQDDRAPRAAARDGGGGHRADDDAEGGRADERAERDSVVAERAVEEVQIERRDAQTEASERCGREVEEGVAPSERHPAVARPSVTSTVCVALSRRMARRTLSPGRNFTISDCSRCSWSIGWSFSLVTTSPTRKPAAAAGEPVTTAEIWMAAAEGRPRATAARGESGADWMPMKPRSIFPFLMSSSETVRIVFAEIAKPSPCA